MDEGGALSLLTEENILGENVSSAPPEFDQLWREHGPTLTRWASRLSGHVVDPQDVLQEVLLVVHRRLPQFRGDGVQLTRWLFRITENVVRQRRRREKFRRWLTGSAEDVAGDLPSTQPSPDEGLVQRQDVALAHRVLDALSEKHRTLLILFEVEQLSGQEISELLDMKLATVWVNLHRARHQFQKRLSEIEAKENPHG